MITIYFKLLPYFKCACKQRQCVLNAVLKRYISSVKLIIHHKYLNLVLVPSKILEFVLRIECNTIIHIALFKKKYGNIVEHVITSSSPKHIKLITTFHLIRLNFLFMFRGSTSP